MQLRTLGQSGLKIAPLVLGGNVFGWTADRETSFAVLDAFLDAGFNAIDTADVYSSWVPGHKGAESETVIGDWMADRGVRDRVVLITKVGFNAGLSANTIIEGCEASLKRLKTDRIDLYFSHKADPKTPIAETLEAHQKLVDAGKVRAVGASNYDVAQLTEALDAAGESRARYSVLQPHYNLLVRNEYEGDLERLCEKHNLGVIPYFALASGFLTGKYRSEADLKKSQRGGGMAKLFTPRGMSILDALDASAARHNATPAQIALAWLMARPSVTAPIASATSVGQVQDLVKAAAVGLTSKDLAQLDI
jgi:aryl-alcohol dehydrogenase-like predicted oxidoreductase